MNTRHDPPAPPEPLTSEERAWAERLALIGPHDGPPAALDAKILAAAHAAVAQRPRRRIQRQRWPTLLGAAASLVIVVGLAWQLQPLMRSRPSLGEGPAAATSPQASSEGSLSDDVLAAADPVAQTAVKSPPPPPEPSTPNKTLRPPQQAVANARRTSSSAAAARPSDFGDDAIPPYTDYAGMAAARQAASQAAENTAKARASTDERLERAASAAPQPFPATRSDAAEAMAAPAAPPSLAPAPSAASGAAAPARDAAARKAATSPVPEAQAEQDSLVLDRIEVTGSRISRAVDLDRPVRDDARLEPAAWLQRIRDRRDAHDLDGARQSLALFRHHHPRVRLPADLAQLGR